MNLLRLIKQLRRGFFALTLVGFTAQSFAHAGLETSVPAANSHVAVAPSELILTYEKPVMLMGLTLTDTKGKAVDTKFKASHDTRLSHKHSLPSLANGTYTVNWTATGKDGHTMKGSFPFTVGEGNHDATKMEHGHHSSMDHSGMNHSDHKQK